MVRAARLPTHAAEPAHMMRALRRLAGKRPLAGAVYCSVVPRVDRRWLAVLRRFQPDMRVLRVGHRLRLGVRIDYPRPATIGADRLANACGAVRRYGAPVIVADFGTAVTFDVISRAGAYCGGVIAPGLPLMFDYLHDRTALLPDLRPGSFSHAVGRSTAEAMQMGARWGYQGMVREILKQLMARMPGRQATVCATGGFAGWALRGYGGGIRLDPDLTLFGLGVIHDLNVSKRAEEKKR